MGISLRKTENSGVVTLSGPIGLEQLRVMNDYVDLLLTNRVTTIYFDFSSVQTLSVSAIGALSTIRDRVDENGGRLLLAGLRDDLNRLVGMDHLRRFFNVFDGPLPEEREARTGAEAEDGDEPPVEVPEATGEDVPLSGPVAVVDEKLPDRAPAEAD